MSLGPCRGAHRAAEALLQYEQARNDMALAVESMLGAEAAAEASRGPRGGVPATPRARLARARRYYAAAARNLEAAQERNAAAVRALEDEARGIK